MTKDNDAGVIAQAYVNVAKECNNDHHSFERAFDGIRSRDAEADRVLDFVDMQMGRERE